MCTLLVACLDRVAAFWVGLLVATRVTVDVGNATTHDPHVSPGNPGAPEVDAAGVYPVAHVPPHTTPHAVYPAGQGVHSAPDLYCPTAHAGEDDGVAGRRERDRDAGVWDGVTTASSRRPARVWAGVDVKENPSLLRVGVPRMPDRDGVCVAAIDRVEVRVKMADLVEVPVDLGDFVCDLSLHAPQVD